MRHWITLVENAAESPGDTFTMWHGGRDLEWSYRDMRGNKSKQMEHGPGLYLTNFYSTAFKYAKGGGKTYLVTCRRGTKIDDVVLPMDEVLSFIKLARLAKKSELVPYLKDRYPEEIRASYFLNLTVNFESLTPAASGAVRKFLVNNGIDYGATHHMSGFPNQTWVVVFNPRIIINVEAVPASAVTLEMHELPVPAL